MSSVATSKCDCSSLARLFSFLLGFACCGALPALPFDAAWDVALLAVNGAAASPPSCWPCLPDYGVREWREGGARVVRGWYEGEQVAVLTP